nr:hypothetical protein [Tanacetum cinerariifolium]
AVHERAVTNKLGDDLTKRVAPRTGTAALDGPATSYYESGKVKSKTTYRLGVPTGRALAYYESGQLKEEIDYAAQGRDRKITRYYDAATPTREAEEQYKNNHPVGTWREFYQDGKMPRKVETYAPTGKLQGERLTYFDNGQVQTRQQYENGQQTGLGEQFFANGRLWKEGTYVKGQLSGPYRELREDGTLAEEGQYKFGKTSGQWTYYKANGTSIDHQVTFRDGKPHARKAPSFTGTAATQVARQYYGPTLLAAQPARALILRSQPVGGVCVIRGLAAGPGLPARLRLAQLAAAGGGRHASAGAGLSARGAAFSLVSVLALRRALGFRGWAVLDAFAGPLCWALAVQSVGCVLVGCCWGEPTVTGTWGFTYGPGTPAYVAQLAQGLLPAGAPHALPVVPTQLYHLLLCAGTGLMLPLVRRRATGWPGPLPAGNGTVMPRALGHRILARCGQRTTLGSPTSFGRPPTAGIRLAVAAAARSHRAARRLGLAGAPEPLFRDRRIGTRRQHPTDSRAGPAGTYGPAGTGHPQPARNTSATGPADGGAID